MECNARHARPSKQQMRESWPPKVASYSEGRHGSQLSSFHGVIGRRLHDCFFFSPLGARLEVVRFWHDLGPTWGRPGTEAARAAQPGPGGPCRSGPCCAPHIHGWPGAKKKNPTWSMRDSEIGHIWPALAVQVPEKRAPQLSPPRHLVSSTMANEENSSAHCQPACLHLAPACRFQPECVQEGIMSTCTLTLQHHTDHFIRGPCNPSMYCVTCNLQVRPRRNDMNRTRDAQSTEPFSASLGTTHVTVPPASPPRCCEYPCTN